MLVPTGTKLFIEMEALNGIKSRDGRKRDVKMGAKRNRLDGNSKPGRGGASFPFPPFLFSSPGTVRAVASGERCRRWNLYDARINASLSLRTLLYSVLSAIQAKVTTVPGRGTSLKTFTKVNGAACYKLTCW